MTAEAPALAIATTRRFDWIAHPLLHEAQRRERRVLRFAVDEPGGRADLLAAARAGGLGGAVFVTIHPVHAFGGPAELDAIAESGLPVCVWNVDSPALVERALPRSSRAAVVHVCESDARWWRALGSSDQATGSTTGIGPHGASLAELRGPHLPIAERPIPLLVPMNLRWCARTLDEVEAEAAALEPAPRRLFERAYESIRSDPTALPCEAVAAALAAEGLWPPRALLRRLSRLVTYAVHLWRRERIVEWLLDLPVVIDSNDLPERLLRGRTPRATLLRESDPRRTVARTAQARAVLSTNFSPDLLHDRPLNAALVGAAAATERNRIFPRWFEHGRSILYFEYARESLTAAVELILGKPGELQEIADAARALVAGGRIDYRFGAVFDALECADDRRLTGTSGQ